MIDSNTVDILIDTLKKLSKSKNGDKLGNNDMNVIAQKGLAKYYSMLNEPNTIRDGYGNSWNMKCDKCNSDSIEVIKPGLAICKNCD